MIYLSAQPDDYYFLWQLQLQLFNFHSLGIKSESIHILIGYNPKKGLSSEFEQWIKENSLAQIFIYPDERVNPQYLSSIRPHIIARHFETHPELKEEVIFYHDSDIVFNQLPDFDLLMHNDVWYASDTRSYLDLNYIKDTAGAEILNEMCRIIGINKSMVEINDKNAGGAQYLLKKTTAEFWKKIEKDAEQLFQLLENHNANQAFNDNKGLKIQAWCADMWALWWNALLLGKQFEIHPELDFCWADSTMEHLGSRKILHYTGSIAKEDKQIFRKGNYVNYSPYYDDLNEISENTCGYLLKDIIKKYCHSQKDKRIDLSDVSFLIPVRIDSEDRLENVYAITNYLTIHFNTSVLITEIDSSSKINIKKLPEEVQYYFVYDNNKKLHRTKYNNQLIRRASTKFIALYDTDMIVPVTQVIESVGLLRENKASMVSPYAGSIANVDRLLKAMFIKIQDAEFLRSNQNKLAIGVKRSYGGVMFMNKEHYSEAGMENENLTSWGPDDIERVKRMEVLGYKVKRVRGDLYHLLHERGLNSSYQSINERCVMMSEYLKICDMEKYELLNYVETWHWKN
ncbi:galactosyltransferase-related protein [Mucilaginibacter sp. OK098]|uniref:galactosyltransferase-related protein n=1 Tax=Mucilaginibacter sp. OK098 TaxID=1855297 RepID=UPI00091E72FA|nr:galactosyltransferase-related protein [Mucilaginibacter sp. OK098]SHM81751.1 Glycosyltransferase like family 2 [Mucilaginibacter sp. OK098]